MPRTQADSRVTQKAVTSPLVADLAHELGSPHQFGQPMIHEQVYPRSDTIHAKVFWDRWTNIDLEKRIKIIFAAYHQAETEEAIKRITVVSGYTIAEGVNIGELPYELKPIHRKSDPVSLEQCYEAMRACGASTLARLDMPLLRFPTVEAAQQCKDYLTQQLPGSDEIWAIETLPHHYDVFAEHPFT